MCNHYGHRFSCGNIVSIGIESQCSVPNCLPTYVSITDNRFDKCGRCTICIPRADNPNVASNTATRPNLPSISTLIPNLPNWRNSQLPSIRDLGLTPHLNNQNGPSHGVRHLVPPPPSNPTSYQEPYHAVSQNSGTFQCENRDCPITCSSKASLTRHMATSCNFRGIQNITPKIPFICEYCPHRSGRSDVMRRHQQQVHTGKPLCIWHDGKILPVDKRGRLIVKEKRK